MDVEQKPLPKPILPAELVAACVATLLLGCVIGALVFGDPEVIQWLTDRDRGVAILGTAGTWIVGAGAWYYARQAHGLRMQEVKRFNLDRRSRSAEAFNKSRSGVLRCVVPDFFLTESGIDPERDTAADVYQAVSAALACAPTANELFRAIQFPDDEMLAQCLPLASVLSLFTDASNNLVNTLDQRSTARLSAVQKQRFGEIRGTAESMATMARGLSEHMDTIRPQLQESE